MKRIISVILSFALAAMIVTPVFADTKITADEVKELMEKAMLLSRQDYCEELLNATFRSEDNILEKVYLRDIVNPEKTYVWYNATQITTEDDEGKAIMIDLSHSIIIDDKKHFTDNSDEPAIIAISHGEVNAREHFPLMYTDFEKVADMLNTYGLTDITGIEFDAPGLKVTAGGTEYIVDEFRYRRLSDMEEHQKIANEEADARAEEMLEKKKSLTPADMLEWYNYDKSLLSSDKSYMKTNILSSYKNCGEVFSDLGSDSFLKEAAAMLCGRGILSGYEDGTFRPENELTRAEAAAVLNKLVKGDYTAKAFADTKDHWAAAYISRLAGAGVINGYGDGLFHPDDTLTFEQTAILMFAIMGYYAEDIAFYSSRYDTHNTNYMLIMMENGLFDGIPSFTAESHVTRADFAKMTANALDMPLCTAFSPLLGTENPLFSHIQNIRFVKYLDGEEIKHGVLRLSRTAYDKWKDEFSDWYYKTYESIIEDDRAW